MTTRRLFFALWPDNRQRERLRDIVVPVAKLVEGRSVDRRDWHVTLVYIGDFPEWRIDELHEARQRITVEPFRLRFDRLEFWPRPRIAALVAATVPPELERLVAELKSRLLDLGLEPEERLFRPHMTLVRNARGFETQRLAQAAVTEWAGFELLESVSEAGRTTYQPLVRDF